MITITSASEAGAFCNTWPRVSLYDFVQQLRRTLDGLKAYRLELEYYDYRLYLQKPAAGIDIIRAGPGQICCFITIIIIEIVNVA